MPKRDDIRKILLLGSGPIVIGQACEFDYSGTQACKALREEGFEVILINSNPATIMTDLDMADRTYIEPIIPEVVEKIIAAERPDAVLPTMGGQTALNVAVQVADAGVFDRYGVQMIGANTKAIKKAEDRQLFKEAMEKIGLELPKSGLATNMDEARALAESIGFPLIIRPSFTLGGTGGGIAYNRDEFEEQTAHGLESSMVSSVLIEESVIGWKEYELEVMRDLKDNVVIICSIENLDPMGMHTGDSITVAPAQTLSDVEYQRMRDASLDVIREIGVETGGSNIQFAVEPGTGRMVIIEMNPRVSRSSALASKATGFPIAKMAAKLAVGYTLDEIPNDITRETPASFEPTIDYCVVKIPRFAFEKFPGTDPIIGISMKSVGETMAIGRTFKEALQKGLRGLEIGRNGLAGDGFDVGVDEIRSAIAAPRPERIFLVYRAIELGLSIDEIAEATGIDPWFLQYIEEIHGIEKGLKAHPSLDSLSDEELMAAKQAGFSDRQLAQLFDTEELEVRSQRKARGVEAVFKLVDTCAAEFEAYTPYYYSTYESEDETRRGSKRKVMILGGGPNRIGQGIEFDYCCVQAAFALREEGYECIMVNSNPETVSTDYDTSDRLYFEPITREDVLNIIDREDPDGVILQFGGQTPLNLALPLVEAGVKILGTSPDSIDRAEDRERFQELLQGVGLRQPDNGTARSVNEAHKIASNIGYPVLVRPSYVLGGRAMEVVYDADELDTYMTKAVQASSEHPVLIDRFLEDAVEVDVDAISDGETVIVGGIMEHIEEAGIHSGDSACVIPPITIGPDIQEEIRKATVALGLELGVLGLMNIQYAVKDGTLYVIEVNPRASRTVPFVSKAIGAPLAKLATKVILGNSLKSLGFKHSIETKHFAVKEAVFPFSRFPGADVSFGPEMRSTGEVMGIDHTFDMAFAKAQLGASQALPKEGTVFVSFKDRDKLPMVPICRKFAGLGFKLIATRGTAKLLKENGIAVEPVMKISEGRPNVVDYVLNGEVQLIINTYSGKTPRRDESKIRSAAIAHRVPLFTTVAEAAAVTRGIDSLIKNNMQVRPIQAYHLYSKQIS